jgi:hypothetical protein
MNSQPPNNGADNLAEPVDSLSMFRSDNRYYPQEYHHTDLNPFTQAHLAVASQFSLQYLIPQEYYEPKSIPLEQKYKCNICDRVFAR